MPLLRITPHIVIDEADLEERFVLSTGPGGQNVNKVASAVQLRFDVMHARTLSVEVRARLMKLAGHRLTRQGVLVIQGDRFRSQERNRADVRERLIVLIREAAKPPKIRKRTRPPAVSRERRIRGKLARSMLKRNRGKPELD